jgi:hypothetical protein
MNLSLLSAIHNAVSAKQESHDRVSAHSARVETKRCASTAARARKVWKIKMDQPFKYRAMIL